MDLAGEMRCAEPAEEWKNNSPQKQVGFPTIPKTEKDLVIDNSVLSGVEI